MQNDEVMGIAATLKALANRLEGLGAQAQDDAQARIPAPRTPPPRAPSPPSPQRPPPRTEIFTIPGGREKGAPLDAASDDALEYWASRIEAELPTCDARYKAKNAQLSRALRAEQDRRATA